MTVWATAHLMVESLLQAGHKDVIVDATNHTNHRRSEWTSEEWSVKLHVVDKGAGVLNIICKIIGGTSALDLIYLANFVLFFHYFL